MSLNQKPWEHAEAEEGGDDQWIVSYADMVTLLFGFFVILYSFSTLDEKKFEKMSEQMSKAFKSTEEKGEKAADGMTSEERRIRALQLLVSMLNLGDSVDQAVKKIESAASAKADMEAVKEMMQEKLKKENGVSLIKAKSMDSPTVEIVLPEKILFQPGMADLSVEAQKKIQSFGKDLLHIPGVEKIDVVGHTDSSAPGKNAVYKSNFALSSARAGAVATELLKAGIPPEMITVKGMADLEPLAASNTTAVNSALKPDPSINRRVHIILRKVGKNE